MSTHHLPKGHTMSNIDRAAEVISLALADDADVSITGNHNDITTVSEATLDGKYDLTAVARALADAGLLAPDPVPPSGSEDGSPWWFYLGDQIVATSGCGDIGIQHTVVIDDEDGSPIHSERWIDLTPEDARHLAAILLTAADRAEGVGTDDQA